MRISKPRATKPRFSAGQRIGSLTITKVHGFMAGMDGTQSKRRWWYQAECDCGTVEDVAQCGLKDRDKCTKCSRKLTRRSDKIYTWEPPPHLDFGRIRFR